jgi:DNA-binding winged helix-turn-helix (wHTH) protein
VGNFAKGIGSMANSGSIGAIRMGNLPVAAEENRILHFSVFEVDLKTGELRRNGTKIRLQEQPFQILSVFLERPGDVVTREELRSRLWPADTFVDFDHSLNTAIRRLRDALGDTAENPRFVETVARRGYRFLAPVNGNGSSVQVPSLAESEPLRPNWWMVAVALAAVLQLALRWVVAWLSPLRRLCSP